jgi:Disulphide bond corrector protein DsbC
MNQTWMPNSTSPQSGRQNLAQGEASEASATLGYEPRKDRARFSGRQKCLSPAKAGSENVCNANPGLRFACPGLNSGVRSADSLSNTSKRSYWVLAFLVVAFAFAGCMRRSEGGISSGTGGFPASSPTPAEVSSSAQVVKVSTDPVQSAPGGSADAIVKLAITSGYHVNANPATYPYLIATEVKPGNIEGITAGAPSYPTATKQKFEFAEEPLAVYEGNIEIKLPLKISATSAGERTLPITVRIQACDTEKCFPPATINTKIPVEVK